VKSKGYEICSQAIFVVSTTLTWLINHNQLNDHVIYNFSAIKDYHRAKLSKNSTLAGWMFDKRQMIVAPDVGVVLHDYSFGIFI